MRAKIARSLSRLNEENKQLKAERVELLDKLAQFEKRATAEKIILSAGNSDDAPSRLQAHDLTDFLAKRAELEDKESDELSKIAGLVEFCQTGYADLHISEEHDGGGDFNSWLAQYAGR